MALREFKVRYSEELVRASDQKYFGYCLRRDFWWIWLLALAAVAMVIDAFERSKWSGPQYEATFIVLFTPVLVLLGYRAQLRNGRAKLKEMGEPIATIAISDTELVATSGAGSGTLRWDHVKAVLETPEFWILRSKDKSKVTIPTQGVDPELFILIRKMLGTKIKVV